MSLEPAMPQSQIKHSTHEPQCASKELLLLLLAILKCNLVQRALNMCLYSNYGKNTICHVMPCHVYDDTDPYKH